MSALPRRVRHGDRRGRRLAALALLTAGCAPASDAPVDGSGFGWGRHDSVSTIVLALPAGRNALLSSPLGRLVFLPLLEYDENGETVGRLAKAWEFSRGGRDVRLIIRDDIRWQDGTPVTVEDVKFSIDLQAHPDVLMNSLGETTVLDDSTLFIRDFEGYNEVYFPKHLLEDLDPADFSRWPFWQHPVGNGPYRIVRYLPETGFLLEANPDHAFGRPKIERVIVRSLDPTAGRLAARAGDVDVALAGPSWRSEMGEIPGYSVYVDLTAAFPVTLFWQTRLPLFEDARVRRALTHAIDRRALQEAIDIPPDLVPIVDGPTDFRRSGRSPRATLPPIPFDPDAARALLVEAGWEDRDGDGIREREGDGLPFAFTAFVQSGTSYQRLGTLVQEQLRRVGVRMQTRSMSSAVINQRVSGADFEAAIRTNGYGPMGRWDHGYRNPELSRLLQDRGYARDREHRAAMAREITRTLQRDVPVTTLVIRPDFYLVSDRVRGLESPWRANPVRHLADLWLEEDR